MADNSPDDLEKIFVAQPVQPQRPSRQSSGKRSRAAMIWLIGAPTVVLICAVLFGVFVFMWVRASTGEWGSGETPALNVTDVELLGQWQQVRDGFGGKLLDPVNVATRAELDSILERLMVVMDEDDQAAFVSEIDLMRFMTEMEATGMLRELGTVDRAVLQQMLPDSLIVPMSVDRHQLVEAYWLADRNSVVAYTWCWAADDAWEIVWWFTQTQGEWRLYDMRVLAFGTRMSEDIAQAYAFDTHPQWQAFLDAGEQLTDAEQNYGLTDDSDCYQQIQEAARTRVHPIVADEFALRVAYSWVWVDHPAAALEVLDQIERPLRVPGKYLLQAHCHWLLDNSDQALAAGEAYEAIVGPSPDVREIRFDILNEGPDQDEANRAAAQLLDVAPDHVSALSKFCVTLPALRKAELGERLRAAKFDAEIIKGLADGLVNYDDAERLGWLLAVPEMQNAPGWLNSYIDGMRLRVVDDEWAAVQALDQAAQLVQDEYIREHVLIEFGEVARVSENIVDVYQAWSDPQQAYDTLCQGYLAGMAWVSRDQLTQLNPAHLQEFPQDGWARLYQGVLAIPSDPDRARDRLDSLLNDLDAFQQDLISIARRVLARLHYAQGDVATAYRILSDAVEPDESLESTLSIVGDWCLKDRRFEWLPALLDSVEAERESLPFAYLQLISQHAQPLDDDGLDALLQLIRQTDPDPWTRFHADQEMIDAAIRLDRLQELTDLSEDKSVLDAAFKRRRAWKAAREFYAHHRDVNSTSRRNDIAWMAACLQLNDTKTLVDTFRDNPELVGYEDDEYEADGWDQRTQLIAAAYVEQDVPLLQELQRISQRDRDTTNALRSAISLDQRDEVARLWTDRDIYDFEIDELLTSERYSERLWSPPYQSILFSRAMYLPVPVRPAIIQLCSSLPDWTADEEAGLTSVLATWHGATIKWSPVARVTPSDPETSSRETASSTKRSWVAQLERGTLMVTVAGRPYYEHDDEWVVEHVGSAAWNPVDQHRAFVALEYQADPAAGVHQPPPLEELRRQAGLLVDNSIWLAAYEPLSTDLLVPGSADSNAASWNSSQVVAVDLDPSLQFDRTKNRNANQYQRQLRAWFVNGKDRPDRVRAAISAGDLAEEHLWVEVLSIERETFGDRIIGRLESNSSTMPWIAPGIILQFYPMQIAALKTEE